MNSLTEMVEAIKRVVAAEYKVTVDKLSNRTHAEPSASARAVAMVIAHNLTDVGCKELAPFFNVKTAYGVSNARSKVRAALTMGSPFYTRFLALQARCAAALAPSEGVQP